MVGLALEVGHSSLMSHQGREFRLQPLHVALRIPRARGFTLIELLIVIGIIALLIGILLPVVSRARASAQRVACRSQLADLGRSFTIYLSSSHNRIPRVNTIPSEVPAIVPGAASITYALRDVVKPENQVWRCSSDRITQPAPNSPTGFETYYEREATADGASSYLYNTWINATADTETWTGKLAEIKRVMGLGQHQVWILADYEPFHGKAGTRGSRNHLFADMHVGDIGE